MLRLNEFLIALFTIEFTSCQRNIFFLLRFVLFACAIFIFFGSEHKFAWPNSSGIRFHFLRSQIRAKCFWSSKVNSCLQLTNISKESFPLH